MRGIDKGENLNMTTKQKRAISYAVSAQKNKRREAFIIEKEGDLSQFKKSKYKSLYWYIWSKYEKKIN